MRSFLSRFALASALCAVALFLFGCKSVGVQPEGEKREQVSAASHEGLYGSHFVGSRGSGDRIVVFVHGIFGSAEDTWGTSADNNWPSLLPKDQEFPKTNIFVAGYPTDLGNKMNVSEMATLLHNEFEAVHIDSQYKEIFFVCHSLGGLVVEQMLLDYRDYAPKTRAIYFFGTPMYGAFIANFVRVWHSDPLLADMSKGDGTQLTSNLARSWRDAKFTGIHRYCAHEKEPTPNSAGVIVVPEVSATYLCDSTNGVPANHINLVKPLGIDSYPQVLLRLAALQTWPLQTTGEQSVTRVTSQSASPTDAKVVSGTIVLRNLCSFYGEAPSGARAWNKDEICLVPDFAHLDQSYRQGDFSCCGGGAESKVSARDIPPGIEIRAQGAYYWSVPSVSLNGDQLSIHTYCGPGGWPQPGCNVRASVIAHYRY
jgi:Putative serine esterase (DUF676)